MKRIIVLLILSLTILSCYDEYIKDFENSAIYFAWPTNVRTFVVGEGMKIEIGVVLAGVRENTLDRSVNFNIDNNLVNFSVLQEMKSGESYIQNAVESVDELKPIPSNYFSLSNNSNITIKAGKHVGSVVMKADSANFLADTATLQANYAIALYLTDTYDADSILETRRSTVIGLKYENMLFGHYWHGGKTVIKDPNGNTLENISYSTSIPQPDSKVWTLTTVAPNTLVANGYSDQTTSKAEMSLKLDGNKIIVKSVEGATFEILPDGESYFNRAKLLQDRKIFLKYQYVNTEGNTCFVQDTLTFRNRIRDGINEWQDENPAHYK